MKSSKWKVAIVLAALVLVSSVFMNLTLIPAIPTLPPNAFTGGTIANDVFNSYLSKSDAESKSYANAQTDCIAKYGSTATVQGILFSKYSSAKTGSTSIERSYSCGYTKAPNPVCLSKLTASGAIQTTNSFGFASGTGTLAAPFIICNSQQLLNVANYPTSNFQLGKNIPMAGINFVPLPIFSGTFNGKGYTISDLNLVYSAALGNCGFTAFYGLFSQITSSGVVQSVILTNPRALNLYGYVGFVTGKNNGTINGVIINGGVIDNVPNVYGEIGNAAGGIAAAFESGEIKNVIVANSRISGSQGNAGIVSNFTYYGPASISNAIVYRSKIAGITSAGIVNSAGYYLGQNMPNTPLASINNSAVLGSKITGSNGSIGGMSGVVDGSVQMVNNLTTASVTNSGGSNSYSGGSIGMAIFWTQPFNSSIIAPASVTGPSGNTGAVAGLLSILGSNYGSGNYYYANSNVTAQQGINGQLSASADLGLKTSMPNLDWGSWDIFYASSCLDFSGASGLDGPVPLSLVPLLTPFCPH